IELAIRTMCDASPDIVLERLVIVCVYIDCNIVFANRLSIESFAEIGLPERRVGYDQALLRLRVGRDQSLAGLDSAICILAVAVIDTLATGRSVGTRGTDTRRKEQQNR